jgi:hypothetical protein
MSRKNRKTEPYRRILATPLPPSLDRRRALTEKERKDVKRRALRGEPLRSIARVYAGRCSRRTIQFIVYPDRYRRALEQFKERRKDGRYDKPKTEHAAITREHRHYKKSVLTK